MPRLEYAVAAQRALIDRQNTLSLIEILEEIQLPAPPAEVSAKASKGVLLPIKFSVVAVWVREESDVPETAEYRVKYVGPSGKEHGAATGIVDLMTYERVRGISETPAFLFSGFGVYSIKIELLQKSKRWKTVSTISIKCKQMQTADPTSKH